MLSSFDPVLLCPDCEVIRTTRSRHCSICNRCVERFDHHCPWINNCVGTGNHHYFMTFLVSIVSTLICVITTASYHIKSYNVFGEQEPFYTILDTSLPYYKELFLLSVSINLITCCFFLLPVM